MSSPVQLHGPNAVPSIELNGIPYPVTLAGSSQVANLSTLLGGMSRSVITAPKTLTAGDSGALVLFTLAAGNTVTLPAAAAGLSFDFLVMTTVTSVVDRIACASGDFLKGTIIQGSDGTYVPVARTADGSTHLAWEGNGTTTGGIVGDTIRVVAQDDTIWLVSGYNSATNSEATPFKTS